MMNQYSHKIKELDIQDNNKRLSIHDQNAYGVN
jgi:hypothetical protein